MYAILAVRAAIWTPDEPESADHVANSLRTLSNSILLISALEAVSTPLNLRTISRVLLESDDADDCASSPLRPRFNTSPSVDEKDVGVEDTNLLPPRNKELFVSYVVVVVVDIVDVVVNNDADAAAGKPKALILSTTIVFVFVFVVVAKSRCPTSMKDEERPRAAILLHTLIFNIILLI